MFEQVAWNWYQLNVSGFALEAGLVADEVRAEGLTGLARRLFVRALGMIHGAMVQEARERSRMAAEAARAQEA